VRRIVAIALLALAVGACDRQADVVSENLSFAADNFEVERRVVMFNGITDNYLLEIIGRCSITDEGYQLEVVCQMGPDQYEKHFLGLSDNVSYFVEQLEVADASEYRYRVSFRPSVIVPDPEFG